MPYDMVGADLTGLAKPYVPTVAQNGTRRIKRITKFKDGTPDLVEEVTVNVAVPIPPMSGGAIRYSLTSTLTPATDPLVQGAVKKADWSPYFSSDAGLNDPDVVKTEWLLDGVLVVTDSSGPFQFLQPWKTTDSAAHTLAVRVYLRSDPTPKTFTATLQTETAGPNPAAPFAWPRSTYQFSLVLAPSKVYPRPTDLTSTSATLWSERPGRFDQADYHTGSAGKYDIEVYLPDDDVFSGNGGIEIRDWRSCSIIGGEIGARQKWPQRYADLRYNKGVTDKNKLWFARGDGQLERRSGELYPVDDSGPTDADMPSWANNSDFNRAYNSTATRGLLITGTQHVWVEGVVFSGPWLTECINLWPSYGQQCEAYFQNIDVRGPVMWQRGWKDSVNRFDIWDPAHVNDDKTVSNLKGHNGGDLFQLGGPVHLHIDDMRVEEIWYQGFFLKPESFSVTATGGMPSGTTSVEMKHVLVRKMRGYQGGGLVTWATSRNIPGTTTKVYEPIWTVIAEDEVYFGGDYKADEQESWPQGHNPPNGSPTGVYTGALVDGVATAKETVGAAPEARLVVALGDDVYELPSYVADSGVDNRSIEKCINPSGALFGSTTKFLGTNDKDVSGVAKSAHYAAYDSARTAAYPFSTSTTTYKAVDYRKYKIWDYNETQPDLATWPGGLRNDLGALNGWSTAGIGYT